MRGECLVPWEFRSSPSGEALVLPERGDGSPWPGRAFLLLWGPPDVQNLENGLAVTSESLSQLLQYLTCPPGPRCSPSYINIICGLSTSDARKELLGHPRVPRNILRRPRQGGRVHPVPMGWVQCSGHRAWDGLCSLDSQEGPGGLCHEVTVRPRSRAGPAG